ncbi:hypothetical protein GPECTOR_65g188 [Gonium pectorale]|uniref:Methyltransferase domain-containing protein n=1 Tax=Gonium pectorale TaxID=33097 RepID=A0A150G5G8_GONPE|nr:hypothetical protein GPECTOR_65g188 [Gonium pectorale]|eukprot:KXZ44570.1 hypothetical protein GPECTOR_65g188 [Gonium pectorale]
MGSPPTRPPAYRARVARYTGCYAEGRKLASLAPHRHAVPPPCPYFGPCGGCTLQSLDYAAQLAEKRNQVEQTLRRVGKLGPSLDRLAAEAEAAAGAGGAAAGAVAATVGCREPFAYRNKTNTAQAAVLYDIVRRAAGLRPGRTDALLDLYCGTGAIGLALAAECREVVGVEVAEAAASDARRNASLNGIANATFLCADVDQLTRLDELLQQHEPFPSAAPSAAGGGAGDGGSAAAAAAAGGRFAPDVVVVDPARGGLSAAAAAFLAGCGARRVVYVSCNVATQARDLDRLVNGPGAAFRLAGVTPVDMFPHTDHVETVAVLERLGA